MKGDDTVELRRHDRRRPAEKTEKRVGAYYAACARRAGFAKWMTVVVLVLFLAVMLTVFHSNITTDNLKYLLRDFSSERSGLSADFADISYEEQSSFAALIFKGELAVIGSSDAALYNSAGEKTFEYKSEMENPAAQATDKYLFAYDLGGTHYSVFSNLTRVLDAHADAVIENASMSEKGSFVLVKRARDAKYTVSLYDASFKNKVNYHKSKFVADAAISPNGKRVAIVTVASSGASISSLLELYEFGADKPFAEVAGGGYLPISVKFFEDGAFSLVCDTRIVFFDKDGAEKSTYRNNESHLTCIDASSSSLCAVYMDDDSDYSVLVFDETGGVIYEALSDQKITDVSHNDGFVFALGAGNVSRFDRTDGSVKSEKCGADMKTVAAAGDFAVVLSENGAECVFGSAAESAEDTGAQP